MVYNSNGDGRGTQLPHPLEPDWYPERPPPFTCERGEIACVESTLSTPPRGRTANGCGESNKRDGRHSNDYRAPHTSNLSNQGLYGMLRPFFTINYYSRKDDSPCGGFLVARPWPVPPAPVVPPTSKRVGTPGPRSNQSASHRGRLEGHGQLHMQFNTL